MPSSNAVIREKMQFQGDRPWLVDERDGFILWLRSEFAAANAIIDSLCQHLRSVGEPGEYDTVFGCVQQRRCNWTPVLHMQHYFPVAEVGYALQQVVWRKQQQAQLHLPRHSESSTKVAKDFKKLTSGHRRGHQMENVKENHCSGTGPNSQDADSLVSSISSDANLEKREEKTRNEVKGLVRAEETDGADHFTNSWACSLNNGGISREADSSHLEHDTVKDECGLISKGVCQSSHLKSESNSTPDHDEIQNPITKPKTFLGTEIHDGKAVNAVEGLKLYEELFDSSDISRLVSLANELRAAGRRGELQGQTYTAFKRPMKGHGREMIQLGLPVADGPVEDEHTAGTSKDRIVEAIPSLLQDFIDHFVRMRIVTTRADSCIIDFFNEGDHSQPHVRPAWYGTPFCILSLTECDIVFGKVILIDRPGDYRGSLKLSLAAGSLLVMQGKSADFAKHAISSIRKQRILITFTKSVPRKLSLSDTSRHATSATAPWGHPLSSRPTNLARHPIGPKHYVPVPTSGVLPGPPIHPPRLPQPNGIQPIFVTAPVAPAAPYPAPVPLPPASAGWPAAPLPSHPPPRLLAPGTGVFLPPGSGHSPPSQLSPVGPAPEASVSIETSTLPDNENAAETSNCNSNTGTSCTAMLDGAKGQNEEHDGGTGNGTVVMVGTEEQLQQQQSGNTKRKVASKPTGAVK